MLAINCRGCRNCQYVSLRVKLTPGVHEGGKDEVKKIGIVPPNQRISLR
jgi:hypothetical protein